MSFPLKYILTGALFFVIFTSNAKTRVFNKPADTVEGHIKNALLSFYKLYPLEKAFLHTDRPDYYAGETIWYKVYSICYGKPDELGKVIYVRLTDTTGNVITQNKHPLSNGTAHGNMDISQRIKSGWYELSAFTSWMMNYGPTSYYHQRIYIYNPADTTHAAHINTTAKATWHIRFYPEGGDMIDDNITRIAFKASDNKNRPVQVNGIIKDKGNNVITTFSSIYDGMGKFSLDVSGAENYTAVASFPDGSQQHILLPKVKQVGVSLTVSQPGPDIQLKISYSGSDDRFSNCTLAATQSNGQFITYQLNLKRGYNFFNLQKSLFATGILRLTVFDHDGLPQAERIIFINRHDISFSNFSISKLQIAETNKDSVSVQVRDADSNPVNCNFSIAVTTDTTSTANNILSALLLSPELHEQVNHPGYYFTNASDSLTQQLDLVMLTNGWRHFRWDTILTHKPLTLNYRIEHSQYIAGKIADYKTWAASESKLQIKLMILNQDSSKYVGYISPDSSGQFILKDFNHSGLSDVYIQATDKKNIPQKIKVSLYTTFSDSLRHIKGDTFANNFPAHPDSYYKALNLNEPKTIMPNNSILLNNVTIKGRKETPTEKVIKDHVSEMYMVDRSTTLDLVNNPTVDMSLMDYIQGKFPGLQIYTVPGHINVYFNYEGSQRLTENSSQKPHSESLQELMNPDENVPKPYFYINESLVTLAEIQSLSLSDVALIRFLPPPVASMPFNGGTLGAIMVYTKAYQDEIKKMASNSQFNHFIFNGYSISREFDNDSNKIDPDASNGRRTLLYWNHDLNSDKNGFIKFNFRHPAAAKNIQIIIQGMDKEGHLAYFEESIK